MRKIPARSKLSDENLGSGKTKGNLGEVETAQDK